MRVQLRDALPRRVLLVVLVVELLAPALYILRSVAATSADDTSCGGALARRRSNNRGGVARRQGRRTLERLPNILLKGAESCLNDPKSNFLTRSQLKNCTSELDSAFRNRHNLTNTLQQQF